MKRIECKYIKFYAAPDSIQRRSGDRSHMWISCLGREFGIEEVASSNPAYSFLFFQHFILTLGDCTKHLGCFWKMFDNCIKLACCKMGHFLFSNIRRGVVWSPFNFSIEIG